MVSLCIDESFNLRRSHVLEGKCFADPRITGSHQRCFGHRTADSTDQKAKESNEKQKIGQLRLIPNINGSRTGSAAKSAQSDALANASAGTVGMIRR